jgi:hypothetical protein
MLIGDRMFRLKRCVMNVKNLSRELVVDLRLSDGGTNYRSYVRCRRVDSATAHVVFRENAPHADGLRDADCFPDDLIVAELDGSVFLYLGL